MKLRTIFLALLTIVIVSGLTYADDGPMFRKNVSHTPDLETERANINHMAFYVPAQSSEGTVLDEGIDYYAADGITVVDTRYFAKPLVAVYIDALPEQEEEIRGAATIMSGTSFGAHDAYGTVSLDDGATWKRTNLSLSAHLSSFTLANGQPYPGDAHNMTFAIAGDRVLVGWISKYCDGGLPAYTWTEKTLDPVNGSDEVKLYSDLFGVMGTQGSIDYTLQGFPEVGEIPYSCVWSARGTLLPVELDDQGTMGYDIVWTKAERLTSGRRDANRLEMAGDAAAGFMMVWQEDPEGLRPGQGLGPGEGWSGAVVNGKTDLWYSYISWDDFEMVDEDGDTSNGITPSSIYDYDLADETLSDVPKVAVPMAVPVRLTDNDMCKGSTVDKLSDPYCYYDFANDAAPGEDGFDSSTFCAETVNWVNHGGITIPICQTEDGRVLAGRVGASRPRVNVQPYDSDGDGVYDSAWVILGAEESKAMGEGAMEEGEDLEPEDIGKNMWYYSFDMLNPDVVAQGGMLNWPAKDPETGEFFEMLVDDFENPIYETEITRRFSHMSQPIHQIGDAGISSVLIVKQGILEQGGPADIFLRLTKVPDDKWVECPADSPHEKCVEPGFNPYAYENLVCEDAEGNSMWEYRTDLGQDGNPRYLQGLCLSTGINVSGTTIDECSLETPGDCVDAFPWDGYQGDNTGSFPKVTRWSQTEENLGDESWANPFDVSKGHRGFIDGDFIMMIYAWSPNWQANSIGNDHYNLYARRSFDGGQTWTTTPAELGGDGTCTTEYFGTGDALEDVPTCYEAGEFEQARNLSQLTGNRETILDPRYTPTGGLKMLPITDFLGVGGEGELPYLDDAVRDPSKFFIVYETGDNTTVAEGEAVPLDLFYSRATNWGDDYDLVEYNNPDNPEEPLLLFDWLEHDREDLSGEAANTCNPGGTFYYAIWNQWQEDEHENVSESDAIFRRVMYLDTVEALPSATILYASHRMGSPVRGDVFTFVGSAWDNDHVGEGIVEYRWQSDIDGVLGSEKTLVIPASSLSLGRHTISFTALDGEGSWARPASVSLLVAENPAEIYLPLVSRH